MDAVLEAIETTDGINSVATLDRFLGAGIPEDMLPESIRSVFDAGGWKMIKMCIRDSPAGEYL